MNIVLYGLKNCDSCRKALKAIEADGHNVSVIDLREDGMDPGLLAGLLARHGGDVLLNRKSTTWRKLSEAEKTQKACTLLSRHPSVMKRPVLVSDDGISFVGWSEQTRVDLTRADLTRADLKRSDQMAAVI